MRIYVLPKGDRLAMARAAVNQDPNAIVGNAPLLARLDRDIRAGRLSHAYILDGPAGSGRHTVARYICAAIACRNRPGQVMATPADEDQMGFFDMEAPPPLQEIPEGAPLPCYDCPACRKVLEGICPDVRLIGREDKATLGVDAIRFLRTDVLIPPTDLDTKIYIIEDADLMTEQAQNALLLTLEEPPSYVLFLLLCNGADALLETIRSRAPVLHTERIPDDTMRDYLRARRCPLSDNDLAAVILRADGCIGQALTLADARALKPILKQRELCDAFITAFASRRTEALPAAVIRFGKKRDGVLEVVSLAELAVRDLLVLRRSDTVRLKYYTDREAAEALAGRVTTRALLQLYEALGTAEVALRGNGNVRLTLVQLAVDLGA